MLVQRKKWMLCCLWVCAACVLLSGCGAILSELAAASQAEASTQEISATETETEAEYLPSETQGFKDIADAQTGIRLSIPQAWQAFPASGNQGGFLIRCGNSNIQMEVYAYYDAVEENAPSRSPFQFAEGNEGWQEDNGNESSRFFFANGDQVNEFHVDFSAEPAWMAKNEGVVQAVARSLRATGHSGEAKQEEVSEADTEEEELESMDGFRWPLSQYTTVPAWDPEFISTSYGDEGYTLEDHVVQGPGYLVYYPRLTNMPNTELMEKINAILEDNAYSWASLAKSGGELEMRYITCLNQGELLSICYYGARKGSGGEEEYLSGGFTVDLAAGKQLRLSDAYTVNRRFVELVASQPIPFPNDIYVPYTYAEIRETLSPEEILHGLKNADTEVGSKYYSFFSTTGVEISVPIDERYSEEMGSAITFSVPYNRIAALAKLPQLDIFLPPHMNWDAVGPPKDVYPEDVLGVDLLGWIGDGKQHKLLMDLLKGEIDAAKSASSQIEPELLYVEQDFNGDGRTDYFVILRSAIHSSSHGDTVLLLVDMGEGRYMNVWNTDMHLLADDMHGDWHRYAQVSMLHNKTNGFHDIHIDVGDSIQRRFVYTVFPDKAEDAEDNHVYVMEMTRG